MATRTPPQSVAARLGTFLLSLTLVAAAGEWVTRRWIETPATAVLSLRFGVVHRPYVRVVQSMEGWSDQRTNAYGFFDDDLRPVRPRIRALLMGDSFAEGLQIPRRETFAAVAEREDSSLEVVNTAGSGRFPAHYAAYVPEYQREFTPDVIVMQVNDGDVNELGDMRKLQQVWDELAGKSPLPRADAPPSNTWFSRLRELLKRSALLRMAHDRATLLLQRERLRFGRKFGSIPADFDDTAGPLPPRAFAVGDSLLGVVQGVNPRLVLVYIPHLDYFATPPAARYPIRRAFWHDLAARRGVPLVDPTDAMLAEYARTLQPLHGFDNSTIGSGHINARGHALIGRLLAEAIEARAR